MKKKFLILLPTITILFLFGAVSVSAEKYGDYLSYTANSDNITITITDCDTSATEIEIPSEINGIPVTSIGDYAFYKCRGLTSITIPDSVTSIGSSVFSGCSGLTSVTIGDSVTSIGSYAFEYCSNLDSVYISDLDKWLNIECGSSYSSPMKYAKKLYLNGKRLRGQITIPDSVTRIAPCALKGCDGITSITIPDSVTSVGSSVFSDCSGLTSVTIGNSVTSIGALVFEGCDRLKDVYITDLAKWCGINFATNSSNPMCYADNLYVNGNLLTELVIPDSVTSIDFGAFYGCSGLTSITIPDSVTSIGDYAFYECRGLTSAKIPDSVTSIGDYAFSGCSGLTSITIPNSVTSIGYGAFCDCSQLKTVNYNAVNCTLPSDSYRSPFYNDGYYNNSSLETVNIGDNVESLPAYLFRGCSGLGNIIIPEKVTIIKESTFYGCSNLQKIFIPKATIEIEKSALEGCSALKTVEYSGSQADWDDMYIGSGNECLTNAKLTFVKPATYTITTSARYGTITPDKTSAVTGDTISFTVAPSAGYILTDGSVKVNNGDVSVTSNGNSYSFTMPNKNVTITATFKKEPEMVTVSFDANEGTLTGESTVKVEKGTALSKSNIPTAAKDGHTFAGWILNGKTFSLKTPIAEEITLTALWIENGIQKTAVQTLPEFNGILNFEKSAGENESMIFTVTKKSDAEIPEPVVFAVHFGTDGSLQSIDKFDFTKSGDTYTAIVDKQTGDYKIFVWTENMQPITMTENMDL